MTTKAEVVDIARNYLRDFPKFFQLSFEPRGRTYNLGKPNVDPTSLWVAYVPTGGGAASPTTLYSLDARNGLLRLPTVPDGTVMIEGYHYEWLLPADLEFYADVAIAMMTHNLTTHLHRVAPAVAQVIGMYTLVQALWALLTEFSRDIDVLTSEGVQVIASQRFRMVQSLLGQWTDKYATAAAALNIGIDNMEVLTLRRISRTTNRYVPIYKGRELGDYGPIERLFPPIPTGFVELEDNDDLRTDVLVDGDPPPSYMDTGWY